ncbi:MAG: DUF4184 family protein [Candidatus Bathyarchaeota archaeon]|nr:DUF4184 family protein [Candidatus Bathyarchaeota archaeon]
MPFTPFHLGPALAVGLPLRRYLHAPTFIVANVILDVEPFLVLVLGLPYPLHGYLHSLLLASAVGLALGAVMFWIEKPLQPFYQKIQLETRKPLKLRSFLLAGVLGAWLHVLLDAFLYSEMEPFYPWTANPMLQAGIGSPEEYLLCVYLGIFGVAYWAALIAYSSYQTNKKQSAVPSA